MRLLVTGASGFVGGAVARHLLANGHEVRALLRPSSSFAHAVPIQSERVPGDLLDPASLRRALRGVDGVFHVAANYTFWAQDPREIFNVNVRGTENLLKAARASGVRRAVFTSSVGVLRAPRPGEVADEHSHARPPELPDSYHQSKLVAEQLALSLNGPDFEVVAVNPTTPVGPGDVRPTPTGRIILEFLNRRMPGYVEGLLNIVDVRDVAIGHLQAFERGNPGQRYILGGLNTTLSGIYRLLAAATGLPRRPVRIPYSLAAAVAWFDDIVEGRVLRREPYIPLAGLRALRHPMHVSTAKAERELGFRASPPHLALRDAAAWFGANGYAAADGSLRTQSSEIRA